jgi:hypothetical protein
MIFENAELKCVETGLYAGVASNRARARVPKIIMRNTTFDCTVANGVCIGAGRATNNSLSEVGSVQIEGGRISAQMENSRAIGPMRYICQLLRLESAVRLPILTPLFQNR